MCLQVYGSHTASKSRKKAKTVSIFESYLIAFFCLLPECMRTKEGEREKEKDFQSFYTESLWKQHASQEAVLFFMDTYKSLHKFETV